MFPSGDKTTEYIHTPMTICIEKELEKGTTGQR